MCLYNLPRANKFDFSFILQTRLCIHWCHPEYFKTQNLTRGVKFFKPQKRPLCVSNQFESMITKDRIVCNQKSSDYVHIHIINKGRCN